MPTENILEGCNSAEIDKIARRATIDAMRGQNQTVPNIFEYPAAVTQLLKTLKAAEIEIDEDDLPKLFRKEIDIEDIQIPAGITMHLLKSSGTELTGVKDIVEVVDLKPLFDNPNLDKVLERRADPVIRSIVSLDNYIKNVGHMSAGGKLAVALCIAVKTKDKIALNKSSDMVIAMALELANNGNSKIETVIKTYSNGSGDLTQFSSIGSSKLRQYRNIVELLTKDNLFKRPSKSTGIVMSAELF